MASDWSAIGRRTAESQSRRRKQEHEKAQKQRQGPELALFLVVSRSYETGWSDWNADHIPGIGERGG